MRAVEGPMPAVYLEWEKGSSTRAVRPHSIGPIGEGFLAKPQSESAAQNADPTRPQGVRIPRHTRAGYVEEFERLRTKLGKKIGRAHV